MCEGGGGGGWWRGLEFKFFLLRIQIETNNKQKIFIFWFGVGGEWGGEADARVNDFFFYESTFKIIFFRSGGVGGGGGEGG